MEIPSPYTSPNRGMATPFDCDSESDEEPFVPFGDMVAQFGDEALVKVSGDTEQVNTLIEQGFPVTAAAFQDACYNGNVEGLQAMLATTTSPGPDC